MSVDDTTVRISGLPRTAAALQPYLAVVAGSSTGRLAPVDGRPLLVGRAEDADLRLADAGASSRHCRLSRVATFVFVEDLASTNGVFVDDVRVEGTAVVPVGATLRFGEAVARLELRDPVQVQRGNEITDELAQAAGYVRALIPPPLTTGPLRVDWRFVPSLELGGDALGYAPAGEGLTTLYLTDCCGHGVRAALHAVSVVNVLRGHALPGVDFARPAAVLDALNQVFAMEQHGGMYFSAWYGVFDAATRRLAWACGGHPPPILLRRDGTREALGARGLAIGLAPFRGFEERSTALAPGDRACVFSDGVYEVTLADGTLWTRGAFEDLLGSMAESGELSPEAVEREVRARAAGGLDDDFSLLLAEAA